MDMFDVLKNDGKARIIQELVPGKQITLAHVIANPDPVLYQKLGLDTLKKFREYVDQTTEQALLDLLKRKQVAQ